MIVRFANYFSSLILGAWGSLNHRKHSVNNFVIHANISTKSKPHSKKLSIRMRSPDGLEWRKTRVQNLMKFLWFSCKKLKMFKNILGWYYLIRNSTLKLTLNSMYSFIYTCTVRQKVEVVTISNPCYIYPNVPN